MCMSAQGEAAFLSSKIFGFPRLDHIYSGFREASAFLRAEARERYFFFLWKKPPPVLLRVGQCYDIMTCVE